MITRVPGILVGHWTDPTGRTGCTVVLCPPRTVGSGEVRGGAPGTRETDLLRPGTLVQEVHAVLLTGGSAFGLAAADGVMRYLEERGIGFETPNLVSSLGVAVMTVGVLLFLWDVWWCRRNGTPAGDDPWGGHSLEWATTSPPPHHNFARVPRIRSERPAFDLRHPERVP